MIDVVELLQDRGKGRDDLVVVDRLAVKENVCARVLEEPIPQADRRELVEDLLVRAELGEALVLVRPGSLQVVRVQRLVAGLAI